MFDDVFGPCIYDCNDKGVRRTCDCEREAAREGVAGWASAQYREKRVF